MNDWTQLANNTWATKKEHDHNSNTKISQLDVWRSSRFAELLLTPELHDCYVIKKQADLKFQPHVQWRGSD